jgi:murein L,D-transpeptidase YcbB/YkuD
MTMRILLAVLLGWQVIGAPPAPPSEPSVVTSALSEFTADAHDAVFGHVTQRDRDDVAALYRQSRQSVLWLDNELMPTTDALDALSLLRHASSDGLDPNDYGLAALEGWTERFARGPVSSSAAATFDLGLSLWSLRHLRDLHHGRVDPRAVGFLIAVPPDEHDYAGSLYAAVVAHHVSSLTDSWMPAIAQYRELRDRLAAFRELAEAAPGEADGAPAKDVSWRIRQIELAMERLRWLPDLGAEPTIVVNVAMFRYWGWRAEGIASAPDIEGRVIVGRARATPTPLFIGEMRQVVFRPYWEVPASIVAREIVPAIRRNPDYLRQQNMEIVRRSNELTTAVPPTPANLERVARGELGVRQRPGPRNALGLVKFVFPNAYSIFMHGTPVQELFNRQRRDLSHGCIRVEDPVALAEWVLQDEAGWSRPRILAAMRGDAPASVDLGRTIHVLILYSTAAVTSSDHAIHFVPDIYGQDDALDRALRAAARRLQ